MRVRRSRRGAARGWRAGILQVWLEIVSSSNRNNNDNNNRNTNDKQLSSFLWLPDYSSGPHQPQPPRQLSLPPPFGCAPFVLAIMWQELALQQSCHAKVFFSPNISFSFAFFFFFINFIKALSLSKCLPYRSRQKYRNKAPVKPINRKIKALI